MTDNVYKHIELTGSSSESIEAAVQGALQRASASVRNMRWFEVTDTRGVVKDGQVACWQVSIKVGFSLED